MIETRRQMYVIICAFILVLIIGGITYAWFTYRGETAVQQLIAGDVYLRVDEGNEEILLTNMFPETPSEARARNDNYMTFELIGKNTSNRAVYYEFILNHGTNKESPNTRYKDEDLRFDLVEINANGDELNYLLSDVGYDTLVNKRIYVDTINPNTSSTISRRYKLRMWISDDVIISDTESGADYTTNEYKNKYATIKIAVAGDFNVKYALGYLTVKKSINDKKTAATNSCNPVFVDTMGTDDTFDDITYFSGDNTCVDMNYIWYSGKLWRITAIYPDGAMKLVTVNNITSIAFNENDSNFYTNSSTKSYIYQWLNEDFYDTLYHASELIDTSKKWNASQTSTISTRPSNTNLVSAKVGLINAYEYYNSYRCIGSNDCTGTSYDNGYLKNAYAWWLLNAPSSSRERYVHASGDVADGTINYYYGVRPAIILKPGIELVGSGTISSPYKIVGDKNTGEVNEFIYNRLSGEYVKLKNGNNEQLFRIIGIEENKTKIIAIDYAANKATYKFSTGSSGADTIWGRGQTTASGTWYTYLNEANTGYLASLVSTYGDLFDTGTYYMGIAGKNYKLGICANTTSGTTKECTKATHDTFSVGLPRYGEMFATQFGSSSNAINMWTITRYSTSGVWSISATNNCSTSNAVSEFGARPTLHLKSTVRIISGTGTQADPYVVGL